VRSYSTSYGENAALFVDQKHLEKQGTDLTEALLKDKFSLSLENTLSIKSEATHWMVTLGSKVKDSNTYIRGRNDEFDIMLEEHGESSCQRVQEIKIPSIQCKDCDVRFWKKRKGACFQKTRYVQDQWNIQNSSGTIKFNDVVSWAQESSSFTIGKINEAFSTNYLNLKVQARSKNYRFQVRLFEQEIINGFSYNKNEVLSGQNGADYRGLQNKTKSGQTCQKWEDQSPRSHTYTKVNYPSAGLDSNYCRNPNNQASIWCHTTS
jgi:hypothetical protein